jgi:site-specific DNA-cytosine methylase
VWYKNGGKMKVLVACEESQRVTLALREREIEAYSCDIIPCSGGHPEYHIMQDVLPLLNGNCKFVTCDGVEHDVAGKWDMIIGFPPCTYLTVTGNRWFNVERYGEKALKRIEDRKEAIQFFLAIANADCEKIAIENPVGIMSTKWRKPDQIINPYMFGDPFEKKTCIWVKGLPLLKATKIVDVPPRTKYKSGKSLPTWFADAIKLPKEERAKLRSKTFQGIADAMADQWGKA